MLKQKNDMENISILLLDDRPGEARQLMRTLERDIPNGMRVVHATTPADALNKIREGKARIALLAVRNGGWRDEDVRRSFLDRVPFLPLVLLVDHEHAQEVARGIAADAPWRVAEYRDDPAEILGAIRALHAEEESHWRDPLRHLRPQDLVADINDVIFLCDGMGVIRYISPQAEKTTGYSHEEIVGRPYWFFIDPADREQAEAGFLRTTGGGTAPLIFRVRTKTQEVRWVRSAGTPILENGRAIGVRGILIDITAEKERETLLIDERAFFRSILDSLLDMITVLDERGKILFVNRPWREIQASEDIPPCLNGHPGDLYPAKVRAGLESGNASLREFHDGLAAVLENRKERCESEISTWTAEGRQYYLAAVTRLLDGEGRIVISLKNITDGKLLEERLAQLSTAVEQSPACIVITDLAGNIEYVNPRFEQLTGYARADVLGKNPRILQSGETPRETYDQLWSALLSGAEWHGEFRNRKKNGELYWENAVVAPIRNPEGEIGHYVAVKEDITRQKEMQEELLAEKLRVEHAGRIKEIFIANMSHEIRTPLTAILGYAELLQMEREGGMSAAAAQHLQYLRESSHRLLRTIENVLHYSAVESGTLALTTSTINLTRELAYLVGSMSETAAAKCIPLAFENEAGEAYIRADERTVADTFQNLLDNALKFTEKGKIVVNLRREKGELVVSIQDTGVGISPEYQPQLFDMFTQENIGYSKKSQGLGLGLALAKRYVEANGGTISILSRKHVGTIAYVRFPEAEYAPAAESATPERALP